MDSLAIICQPQPVDLPTGCQKRRSESTILVQGMPVSFAEVAWRDTPPARTDQVLIQTLAFSCNYRDHGTAIQIQQRVQRPDARRQAMGFGSELVGRVVRLGREAARESELHVGQHVILNHQWPQPAHPGAAAGLPTNHASNRTHWFYPAQLVPLDPEMPLTDAAAISIAGQTAYGMVRRADVTGDETILVTAGSANTSRAVVQALRARPGGQSLTIVVTTTAAGERDTLLAAGASEVIVLSKSGAGQPEQLKKGLREIGPIDLVFDPFFDLHLNLLLPLMAFGGRYITCGFFGQGLNAFKQSASTAPSLKRVMSAMMLKNLTLRGNCLGKRSDLEQALADYRRGRFRIPIDSAFSQGQSTSFLRRTFESTHKRGKVIFLYE